MALVRIDANTPYLSGRLQEGELVLDFFVCVIDDCTADWLLALELFQQQRRFFLLYEAFRH